MNKRQLVGLTVGFLLLLNACAIKTVKEPKPPDIKISVEEGTVLKDHTLGLSAGKTEIEPPEYKIAGRTFSKKENTEPLRSKPKDFLPPPPKVSTKPRPEASRYRHTPWLRPKAKAGKPATPSRSKVKQDEKPPESFALAGSVKKTDSDEYVVLNFENVDLNFVLQYISEIIGMNYILGTNVSGKITIQTYNKIPKSELFSVLHTILEINGFTTVKQKNYYKLIKLSEAKQYPIETVVESDYRKVPPEDIPVTQVIALREMEAGEAAKIIKPFMSRRGSLITHKDLGIIILSDLQSNIRRLMKIISLVDTEIELPDQIGGGQLFVYFLENIDAKDLAGILNKVFAAKKKRKNINVPLRIDRSKKSRKKRKKASKTSTITKLGSDVDLEGDIKIVPDDINNALIIKATPRDYKTILGVIKKLDIIPRQVLIEILVVDISLDKGTSMGVEWALANHGSQGDQHAFGSYKNFGSSFDTEKGWVFSPKDGTLPFIPMGFNYLVQTDKFMSFIQAAANDSKAKVISSPHILAVNNKEASIQIVDSVPIPLNTIGTGTNPSQSGFEYRDAGTKLSVKPKINARGLINMEISQEVSEPVFGGDAPAFKKRTAKTSAIVKSGQTIVIGGMIRETVSDTRSGIPYLMDIPYLGWLFGTKGKSISRSELVMLITPHAILTEEDAKRITREFSQPLESLEDLDTSATRLEKLRKYQQIRPKKKKVKEKETGGG